jgi:hypothetical protein
VALEGGLDRGLDLLDSPVLPAGLAQRLIVLEFDVGDDGDFAIHATLCPQNVGKGKGVGFYSRRSIIIALMWAIALAGLRCFGQVWAQFMIVWQR